MTEDHLDAERLADLQAGLLDAAAGELAQRHLAGCARCRTTRDGLDEVRARLRVTAPDDAAPDDVVRRLAEALAAAATEPVRPAPAPVASGGTVTPFPAAPGTAARTVWSTRVLQSAAVFVLLAAAVAIGYGALHGGDSGGTANSAAAGAGKSPAPDKLSAGDYAVTVSGRNYSPDSLRAAVPGLLSGNVTTQGGELAPTAASGSSSGVDDAGPDALSRRLGNPAALAACVANVVGSPAVPLAVDMGRFEGAPATVIVVPDPDDAGVVRVYAVDPGCPTGTWLDLERVPRP